jgi:GNAT superfamily N-acetyltransferase
VALEDLRIGRAEARHAAGLSRLFGANGYGCHCRYWHFAGDSRAWLARCASQADENEREFTHGLSAGTAEALGVVAELPGEARPEVVGWLKLSPASLVSKIYEQRLYKSLPCFQGDRAGIFTIGCLLVDEGFRRKGVARALVRGAVELAKSLGATAVEAFPRSDADVPAVALMMGPTRVFVEAGFEVVHDFGPYPVLRHTLTPPPRAP